MYSTCCCEAVTLCNKVFRLWSTGHPGTRSFTVILVTSDTFGFPGKGVGLPRLNFSRALSHPCPGKELAYASLRRHQRLPLRALSGSFCYPEEVLPGQIRGRAAATSHMQTQNFTAPRAHVPPMRVSAIAAEAPAWKQRGGRQPFFWSGPSRAAPPPFPSPPLPGSAAAAAATPGRFPVTMAAPAARKVRESEWVGGGEEQPCAALRVAVLSPGAVPWRSGAAGLARGGRAGAPPEPGG